MRELILVAEAETRLGSAQNINLQFEIIDYNISLYGILNTRVVVVCCIFRLVCVVLNCV